MRKVEFNNMLSSLLEREVIETTLARAKRLKPFAEHIIHIAKSNTLAARRQVAKIIRNKRIIAKLFSSIATRFSSRNGGYTRIMRKGFRRGDGAPIALLEIVDRPIYKKADKKKKEKGKKEDVDEKK